MIKDGGETKGGRVAEARQARRSRGIRERLEGVILKGGGVGRAFCVIEA